MPKKGDVHVMQGDRGWRVEVEGGSRASSTHKSQKEAWQAARDIAKRNNSEALLRGRDGKIRERNHLRADPHPPKG
jgi:hypothetical protein